MAVRCMLKFNQDILLNHQDKTQENRFTLCFSLAAISSR